MTCFENALYSMVSLHQGPLSNIHFVRLELACTFRQSVKRRSGKNALKIANVSRNKCTNAN